MTERKTHCAITLTLNETSALINALAVLIERDRDLLGPPPGLHMEPLGPIARQMVATRINHLAGIYEQLEAAHHAALETKP